MTPLKAARKAKQSKQKKKEKTTVTNASEKMAASFSKDRQEVDLQSSDVQDMPICRKVNDLKQSVY